MSENKGLIFLFWGVARWSDYILNKETNKTETKLTADILKKKKKEKKIQIHKRLQIITVKLQNAK